MRGQPTTYSGAFVRAALVIGAPLLIWTLLDGVAEDLSWGTALLRLLLWAGISALMALAFAGGVEPRQDREDGEG